jgi:hypothetical protein
MEPKGGITMGGVRHMMDEVAARMEIDDPNDPKVQAEVERLLSITNRRLVVLETHPNSGGMWFGKMGTESEIFAYLKKLKADGTLDYVYGIVELKDGAEDEACIWIQFDGSQPVKVNPWRPDVKLNGTPPLPGLEARLAKIEADAYGEKHSVWSILQSLSDQEISELFSVTLESCLQEGRTLVIPEVAPCQSS